MNPTPKKELALCDKVMTQISPYPGEIIKIIREQGKSSHSWYSRSEPPTTIYQVLVPFLKQGEPVSISKYIDFTASELTAI